MELILNDQIRRGELIGWKTISGQRIAGTVETVFIVASNAAEKLSNAAGPRHRRKLIHRGNHETRQPAIDGFVDRKNRQRVVARESAIPVHANDAQIVGRIRIGNKLK